MTSNVSEEFNTNFILRKEKRQIRPQFQKEQEILSRKQDLLIEKSIREK